MRDAIPFDFIGDCLDPTFQTHSSSRTACEEDATSLPEVDREIEAAKSTWMRAMAARKARRGS
jgi:hypothetical protein